MNCRVTFVLVISALAFVLIACAANSPTATPSKLGVRVATQGGTYTNVAPGELQQMLANKNFWLVNVHIPYEGEIDPTDAFVAYNEIEKNLDKLPKDKGAQIVLYCRSGRMSQAAAETLVKLGYTNVWNLDRGMIGWEQAGLPIVIKIR